MSIKYTRSWTFEDYTDIHFVDGSTAQCFVRTNDKGQIDYIEYEGETYTPEQFDALEISYINFMTPRRCEVESSTEVLLEVYLRLADEIPQAISNQDASGAITKARIRSEIAETIHKRGLNMHELLEKMLKPS